MDIRSYMIGSRSQARASWLHKGHDIMLHVLVFAMLVATFTAYASAQSSFSFRSRSYINPFPQTDRYHLHIFGDYLAGGLSSGLVQAFQNDGSIKISNFTKSSAGLARPDRTNWAADIAELAKTKPVHIAVLMMGINDVRRIRLPGSVAKWGTEAWRNAYADQVDKLIRALKERNIAVYWVGLPVMAKGSTSEAMAIINDILRERSYINGTKFIDSWSGFTDQLGGFSAYGPDITGQNKRLRDNNGITFTKSGNRKLANFVEVILRRDLDSARRQRNLSLAGDKEEQSRLVPKLKKSQPLGDSAEAEIAPKQDDSDTQTGENPVGDTDDVAANAQQPVLVEIKDDAEPIKAKSDEDAEKNRLSAFASGYSPPGETIIGDISDGVTGLATVSPIGDLNVNPGQRSLPLAERLYFRSLVKGEALKPKPGRADDFRWPRS